MNDGIPVDTGAAGGHAWSVPIDPERWPQRPASAIGREAGRA